MGSTACAHLAYGYDLGSEEDPRFAEKGEYGEISLPWFDDEETDEDEGERGFVEQLFNHLYWLIPDPPPAEYNFARQEVAEKHYGIEIHHPGYRDNPGIVLAAAGSESFVSWSETMPLDPAALNLPRPGWDAHLSAALSALGITPTQDGPKWLVFPSYG